MVPHALSFFFFFSFCYFFLPKNYEIITSTAFMTIPDMSERTLLQINRPTSMATVVEKT
jgi:hypothetical protein